MGEQCRNPRMKSFEEADPRRSLVVRDRKVSGRRGVKMQAVSNPLQVQEGAEWLNLVTRASEPERTARPECQDARLCSLQGTDGHLSL